MKITKPSDKPEKIEAERKEIGMRVLNIVDQYSNLDGIDWGELSLTIGEIFDQVSQKRIEKVLKDIRGQILEAGMPDMSKSEGIIFLLSVVEDLSNEHKEVLEK